MFDLKFLKKSNSKVMYRVAEPRVVISFTSNYVLSDLEDSRVNFPDDRFRFHSYEEFEAACDLKGDPYGALALVSMSSSRVFLDFDVQLTRDYVTWVDAKVVTKTETMTIEELFSYIKQEAAKVAWFECTTTVDAVFHGSPWYYIGCGVCHTKAIKGPTSLMCKKCGKHEVDAVPQYLTKLSVYDNNDQAVFVILGEAGRELTGKQASELVESYFEANESMGESMGDDHLIPVPQTLVDTIRRTYMFIVKVSDRNLKGHIHTLTVTKVLPLDAPEPVEALVETVSEEPVDGRVKRGSDLVESGEAKRAKSGN
ncbi:unnamed protein product [Brassica napus]|nr:unnamed protein product [Brassica napus]